MRKSLDVFTQLAATAPADAGAQRDLFVTDELVADTLRVAGRLDESLKMYGAAREIAEKLAAAEPANLQRQYDLQWCYGMTADVQLANGDIAGGQESIRRQVAVAQRLVAGDAENSDWQWVLSVNVIGTIRLAVNNTLSLRYPGYWIGLPRPASGFVIVFLLNARLFAGTRLGWLQLALIVALALSGLSRLPYKNHKGRLRPLEKAFPIVAILSSLACYPFGWMWDLGLAWGVVYLCAPWLALSAEERAGIAAAVNANATSVPV
jgi:hypothetical protein